MVDIDFSAHRDLVEERLAALALESLTGLTDPEIVGVGTQQTVSVARVVFGAVAN